MSVITWKVLVDADYVGGKKVNNGTVDLTYAQAEYALMQGHITRAVDATETPVVLESETEPPSTEVIVEQPSEEVVDATETTSNSGRRRR